MSAAPAISVLIPARNEEQWLPGCLASIRRAARYIEGGVETIVCLNRCTDATEELAQAHGCRIVREDAKNLSLIRNAAAAAAQGSILVTIDADSRMTPNLLWLIAQELETGRVIGGGTSIHPDRISLGIVLTGIPILAYIHLWHRISCGCFWCKREHFDAIGGFDPAMRSAEDIDFAKRLRDYGRTRGLRFGTIHSGFITTSCRKFDEFGDWYALRNLPTMLRLIKSRDSEAADRIWYDVER